MDKTDMRILRHLMMDGRQSARQLALRLDMSTVTMSARIKKLEKEGIISGYAAMINHEKLGYCLTAIIEVVAKNDKMLQIEDRIAKFENVCGVYDVTGTTDTMIVAKFKTRDDLSKFVKTLGAIPNVKNTITHVVLNTIKEDFRMT
ncbi:MAG: Lrp/AsnC family transcriptional regulator [Nitrosopumilus sp. B06]|nr:MAG: Lrp/AsnC family transcriptional regulator [Nitrosopumilus sp. D6]RNJ79957.1 MAG: Lrp/AsnC family transcriptional regulator [Nitrosopumilus sp. B06]